MAATGTPYELVTDKSLVEVILHPQVADTQWAEVEAFGSDVVAALKDRNRPSCLIDLAALSYMGSAMVALIVRLWKVVKEQNGKMAVVSPNPMVTQVISLAGLDKVWIIVPDRATAQKEFGRSVSVASTPGASGSASPVGTTSSDGSSSTWPWIVGIVLAFVAGGIATVYFGGQNQTPAVNNDEAEAETETSEEAAESDPDQETGWESEANAVTTPEGEDADDVSSESAYSEFADTPVAPAP